MKPSPEIRRIACCPRVALRMEAAAHDPSLQAERAAFALQVHRRLLAATSLIAV